MPGRVAKGFLLVGISVALAACSPDQVSGPELDQAVPSSTSSDTSFGTAGNADSDTSRTVVIGAEGGTVTLEGAVLSVPEGSVDSSVAATLQLIENPTSSPASVSALSGSLRAEIEGPWTRTVSISLPVDSDALGGDEPIVAYRDVSLEMWVPAPTSYVDGIATAEVDHLSDWDVFGSANYWIQDLLGNRADPPSCAGPLPPWVETINVVDDRNAPLLACGEADGDSLILRVGANRGYSMTLHANVDVSALEGGTTDIGHAFAQAVSAQTGDRTYVPAGGITTVAISKPPEIPKEGIEVRGKIDTWSVAGDLAVKALGAANVSGAELESFLACVVRLIEESPQLEDEGDVGQLTAGAAGAFLTCVDTMADTLGSALSVGLHRFLIAVDIWDFAGTAAEGLTDSAFDLAYLTVIPRVAAFAAAGEPPPSPVADGEVVCSDVSVERIASLMDVNVSPDDVEVFQRSERGLTEGSDGARPFADCEWMLRPPQPFSSVAVDVLFGETRESLTELASAAGHRTVEADGAIAAIAFDGESLAMVYRMGPRCTVKVEAWVDSKFLVPNQSFLDLADYLAARLCS